MQVFCVNEIGRCPQLSACTPHLDKRFIGLLSLHAVYLQVQAFYSAFGKMMGERLEGMAGSEGQGQHTAAAKQQQ